MNYDRFSSKEKIEQPRTAQFKAGVKAYKQGKTMKDNPYIKNGIVVDRIKWRDWNMGWCDADLSDLGT